MSTGLRDSLMELTGSIVFHSENLVRDYQPIDLHQFRVNSRHIRSILKQLKRGHARDFNKAWGGFFAATSEARDWDVFVGNAAELLSPEQFALFYEAIELRIRSSHDEALDALQSHQWERHLGDWQRFLERLEGDQAAMPAGLIAQVIDKARKVCVMALAVNDDYTWHRFRIAVKNIRYVANACLDDPGYDQDEITRVIETCKVLQAHLGVWHDTVVQLELLAEDESFAGTDPASELGSIQSNLVEQLAARKHQLLDQVREALAEQDLFSEAE